MRVLIVGAGGVGGYIGAQLIRNTDANVTFLARKEHLKAIQKNGLHIIDNNTPYTLYPSNVVANTQNEGVFDLIIIAVKSYDLKDTLKELSKNIDANTVILPLLNGIDHNTTIKTYYPETKVLKGCIYIISHIAKPGTIIKKGKIFKLCWGDPNAPLEEYKEIAALFDQAKLRHQYTQNIEYEIWKKYLFIAAMAALTSYYKKPMDRIYSEHRDALEELLKEIIAIGKSHGVPIGQEEFQNTLLQASKVLPGAKTSLQLDLEKGKRGEIDSLLGYIVASAQKQHIQTPLMQKLYSSLQS